jgi:hypothetical protein
VEIQPGGHTLKLCFLIIVEAVQPLGQVVQLIEVGLALLQLLERRKIPSDFFHAAVALDRVADLQGSSRASVFSYFSFEIGNGTVATPYSGCCRFTNTA